MRWEETESPKVYVLPRGCGSHSILHLRAPAKCLSAFLCALLFYEEPEKMMGDPLEALYGSLRCLE